jgi:nitrous oxidase accessory protein
LTLSRIYTILFVIVPLLGYSETIRVGPSQAIHTITEAIEVARDGDTILVEAGLYREGNIQVTKKIHLLGIGYPILDGQKKFEVLSIRSGHVKVDGFNIRHSGFATLDDPCAVKLYDCVNVIISNNILVDNFFGIYVQYGRNCVVRDNHITAFGVEEQQIGNGIHCWKSDSLLIIANTITGHRDGIYFEFVTNSVIWRNIAFSNIRYGLHFMFSNNDAYITNVFRNNGAGVAVMFTKKVIMINNSFEENWGDGSYGLLLKEISDAYIQGNHFRKNTTGLYMEGTNRILFEENTVDANGWGMKIQASCMDNEIRQNNFTGNTFDISTNGTLVLNTFNNNYWDKYEGYDLNRDGTGDIPYHPLSLFAVITENNPATMLLYRSFIVSLLDKSEKLIPSLTPDNFIDRYPLIHSLPL